MSSEVETIVIGGGQAGLAVGYFLQNKKIPFRILDANTRVGNSWRNRWDSLRLFTTARYVGLPGYRFPGPGDAYPSKDQMADYLFDYADRFHLPVENGVRVDSVSKSRNGFLIRTGSRQIEAKQVVVAMANYQEPRIPEFAQQLSSDILQLHSKDYRTPSQLKDGGVLVVGAGNSAADIALEVSRTHQTWMSGKESGFVPFRIETFVSRFIAARVVRFVFHHVLSLSTPIGRKHRATMLHQAAPLVRVKPNDLIDAGVQRVPRVVGVRNGFPQIADEQVLDVANVIWCTGFHPGFSWLDLPVFDEQGDPIHERGVVNSVPGLYFVGLHFLYSLSSATLMGIGRDAKYIANAVASRIRERRNKKPDSPRKVAA